MSYQKQTAPHQPVLNLHLLGVMNFMDKVRLMIRKVTGRFAVAARSFCINPLAFKGIVPMKWYMIPGISVLHKSKLWNSLTNLNDIIEIKVMERTTNLEDSRRQLESFAYSVSHDLKSPLRVINGYCSILKNSSDMSDTEGKDIVRIISDNAIRMSRLIDDLLRFAQTGCEHLTKKPTDMSDMVKEVVDELSGLQGIKAQINIHRLPAAHCDPHLIRQAWVNLISNAIKYSSKEEQAVIDIGAKYSHGVPVYYVKDNGAGFDMKYAGKLFTAFQRLHSNADFEGTGIGLALTHRIISKHGGKIWADATAGRGAKFSFTLSEIEPQD